jgi:hypothetical protein
MYKLLRMSLVLTFLLSVAGVVPAAGQDQPGRDPNPPNPSPNKVYLPLTMNSFRALSVAGQVTDETGNPLPGVVLSSGSGITTTTGADGSYIMGISRGDYSVAALKNGVGFLPTAMDLKDVQENVASLDFTGTGCAELITNGSFETSAGWTLVNSEVGEVISRPHALKLGLVDPATNTSSVSMARSDAFTIPSTAKDPMLRLWIFTQSTTPTLKNVAKPERQPGENFFGPDTDSNDQQLIQILSADGLTELEPLIDFGGRDRQEWGLVQFNLYKYVGQTIRLGFKVSNDGLGSATAMLVDDVNLATCPTVYAPEGLNSSALAPDACANQINNPGFEFLGGWSIPYTAYPARYNSNAPYPETVHSGTWSMQTGIPKYLPYQNRYSYSDAWQTIYIPPTATSATLDVWVKLASTEAPYMSGAEGAEVNLADSDPAFAPGKTWGEEPLAYDSSYILILNPYNGVIRETLRAWPAKNNVYKPWPFDLMAYRGQNIRIQFGTYNDGYNGVTSMYVDDLTVNICDGGLPPPPPPSVACPAGYNQQLVNNSFETNNGWYRPVTAYTARYTNLYAYTGVRSMQTGIFNFWHNRYSYSDFGQYVYIPAGATDAILSYWVYQFSGGGGWGNDMYDKQYLLVLNNWGYWIDTLLWNNGRNSGGWQQVLQHVTYMRGYPLRLQFGTYNNGWYGITSMFVDDVTLCTTP